jgi:AraC-like DNA-binding protein
MMEAGSECVAGERVDSADALHSAHAGALPVYDPLAAETALLDALSTLIARHADARLQPHALAADEPRVDAMRERLAADLTCSVTLDDVAQAVGLSPFHAARLFTRTIGMPPHAWRNQLRLQRALAPLRAGASVADVAAATGFVDQSHFTRHFKRMFGVPPGRWQAR